MELKRQAAAEALKFVKSGMVLGIGSGSTVAHFIELLGEALKSGELENIVGVPTSEESASKAEGLGIPLGSLDVHEKLDLAIDGADEVDPKLNLIKGLGKALLREKIVEVHAEKFVVIVDESKIVEKLGTKGPLPVEILPFAREAHVRWLNTLGCHAGIWMSDNEHFEKTDNGNNLVKCHFENGIDDPYEIAKQMCMRPGIVEHGLFLDMATAVVVAAQDGVRMMERPS